MNKYQLLIFDWDGTLVDSLGFVTHCLQAAATELGLRAPTNNEIEGIFGNTSERNLAYLFPGEDHASILHAYQKHYFGSENEVRFFPGAINTLRKLKDAGFTLAVATNKSRRGLNAMLDQHHLTELFSATRTPEDGYSKPEPEMVWEILSELDIARPQTLMIGDTAFDMELARNAGIDALAICHRIKDQDALQMYSPIGFINRIECLWDVVNGKIG